MSLDTEIRRLEKRVETVEECLEEIVATLERLTRKPDPEKAKKHARRAKLRVLSLSRR